MIKYMIWEKIPRVKTSNCKTACKMSSYWRIVKKTYTNNKTGNKSEEGTRDLTSTSA